MLDRFLAPAWDSGAAPCFLFEETAEKRVCVRQLASSMPRLIWVGAGQLRFARNPRPPLREEQPVLLLVREQHCFCPQLFAQSSFESFLEKADLGGKLFRR